MKYILTIITLSIFSLSTHTMYKGFIFTIANPYHIGGILRLVGSFTKKDKNKLVVTPKKFRKRQLANSIYKRQMFVVTKEGNKQNIVGFRKTFIIKKGQQQDILKNEIRCYGPKSKLLNAECFITLHPYTSYKTKTFLTPHKGDTYVYLGSSFICDKFRGSGIYHDLTQQSIKALEQQIVNSIKINNSPSLNFVFGLVKENAGHNGQHGLEHQILRSLVPLLPQICNNPPQKIFLNKYAAFKPTFDPDAKTNEPLGEDKSVPGYGCVLVCPLSPENENNSQITKEN